MAEEKPEIEQESEFYVDLLTGKRRRRKRPRKAPKRYLEKDELGRAAQTDAQQRVNTDFNQIRSVLAKIPDPVSDAMLYDIHEILLSIKWECVRHVGCDEYVQGTIWEALGFEGEKLEQAVSDRVSEQRNLLT